MAVTAIKPKNAVESLREIVQDPLVPELKAIKVEIEALRTEIRSGDGALRLEMRLRDENQTRAINSLTEEMRLRDQKQNQALQNVSDKQTQAIQALSDKLGSAMDVRERLAVL